MNKKVRRLVQPSVVLYFVVMGLFCVAAVALRQYILAAAEAGVTLVLLGVTYLRSSRRKRALAAYVQSTSELMERTSGEVPFPVALVKLNDNELVWCNKAFSQLAELRESMIAPRVTEIFPGFSMQWLTGSKPQSGTELRFRDHRYRVSGTVLPEKDARSGVVLGMIYLLDQTELLQVRDEYIRSRPIVTILLVDNY